MKKISELINLKNLLLDTRWESSVNELCNSIEKLKSNVDFVNCETNIDSSRLAAVLNNVQSKSNKSVNELSNYVNSVNSLIREYDGELREMSMQLDKASNTDSPEQILKKISDRENTHHEFTKSLFAERCKIYSNWKYPGMHIRPGYGTWTRNLVDLDPLYLVDIHEDLLNPAKKQFNENYRARLRFKTISDVDTPVFGHFPNNQFGLIVATEFFNQKSLGTFKRYFEEIFSLLREGGVFVFTFNDCDFPEGARNSEHCYDCYTPGDEIKSIIKNAGFNIMNNYNSNGTMCWMEIQKPGKRYSLRGGQPLAKILNKE